MNILRLNKEVHPIYWIDNFLSDDEIEKIGHDGISDLHYHEIEQQALELLNETEKEKS